MLSRIRDELSRIPWVIRTVESAVRRVDQPFDRKLCVKHITHSSSHPLHSSINLHLLCDPSSKKTKNTKKHKETRPSTQRNIKTRPEIRISNTVGHVYQPPARFAVSSRFVYVFLEVTCNRSVNSGRGGLKRKSKCMVYELPSRPDDS